jgi:oligosaccharide translocation protein RFT1
MTAFSMIYISTALTLYRLGLGDVSLVYANIANLAIRIAYCLWFVTSYFRVRRSSGLLVWKNVAPRWEVLTALVLSEMVIRFSESALNIPGIIAVHKRSALLDIHVVTHILLGGTLLALCSGVWWIFSGQFLTLTCIVK